jgi:predicted PurR-regulated permease PerM
MSFGFYRKEFLIVITVFLALLPVGGTARVWGPAVVYFAAASQWGWAAFMLVWGPVLLTVIATLLRFLDETLSSEDLPD